MLRSSFAILVERVWDFERAALCRTLLPFEPPVTADAEVVGSRERVVR